jgi:hypothetical protein
MTVSTPTDRKEIVNRYAQLIHDPNVLFPPIPGRELNSALETYATDVDPDAVLALVDNTVSAGAKEGLVLTGTRLYGRNWGQKPKCIELNDIKTASAKGHLSKSLLVNGGTFVALGCPTRASIEMFARMLEELAAAPPLETTRVCPDCAEEVKAAAVVCRFCGHRFDQPTDLQPAAENGAQQPELATPPATTDAGASPKAMCADCRESEARFRCTRCDRQYCEGCITTFGVKAARVMMERVYGSGGGLTFGSAKVFDDKGRAFCPRCYGALLDRATATGQWVVQSEQELEPSCVPLAN